jgi:hypothetical protein
MTKGRIAEFTLKGSKTQYLNAHSLGPVPFVQKRRETSHSSRPKRSHKAPSPDDRLPLFKPHTLLNRLSVR